MTTSNDDDKRAKLARSAQLRERLARELGDVIVPDGYDIRINGGRIHSRGCTRAGKWYPGPAVESSMDVKN